MRSTEHPSRWIATAFFAALMAASGLTMPGHALAADADCDTIDDGIDNCPDRFNPTQSDIDGDNLGDRCDTDKDGDGFDNPADNCPKVANADQLDTDSDGVGDVCDQCAEATVDAVGPRGCSIDQLCPCDGPDETRAWKNHDQYFRCVKKKARDFRRKNIIDGETREAVLDAARGSICGAPVPGAGDNDGDGVADGEDNCPSDSNPSQRNTDGDSFGDACDTDKDNDGVLNGADNCPLVANASGQADDSDGDSVGDACDVCGETAASATVDDDGCSLDQACPCDQDADGNPWASHGKYYRCYSDEVFRFRLSHLVTGDEADQLKMEARANDCGDRPPVCE